MSKKTTTETLGGVTKKSRPVFLINWFMIIVTIPTAFLLATNSFMLYQSWARGLLLTAIVLSFVYLATKIAVIKITLLYAFLFTVFGVSFGIATMAGLGNWLWKQLPLTLTPLGLMDVTGTTVLMAPWVLAVILMAILIFGLLKKGKGKLIRL